MFNELQKAKTTTMMIQTEMTMIVKVCLLHKTTETMETTTMMMTTMVEHADVLVTDAGATVTIQIAQHQAQTIQETTTTTIRK